MGLTFSPLLFNWPVNQVLPVTACLSQPSLPSADRVLTVAPLSLWVNVGTVEPGNSCSHHVCRRPALCYPEFIALLCTCTCTWACTHFGWTWKLGLSSRGPWDTYASDHKCPGLICQSFAWDCEGKRTHVHTQIYPAADSTDLAL